MVIAAHRADTVVAEELPVGRLPLLDRQPRSATVTADEDLVCYVLSADAFDALTIDDPPIAIHLLSSLGPELSRRLRRATPWCRSSRTDGPAVSKRGPSVLRRTPKSITMMHDFRPLDREREAE